MRNATSGDRHSVAATYSGSRMYSPIGGYFLEDFDAAFFAGAVFGSVAFTSSPAAPWAERLSRSADGSSRVPSSSTARPWASKNPSPTLYHVLSAIVVRLD